MNQRVQININDVIPSSIDVFKHQGIPGDAYIPDHIIYLFDEAVSVFKNLGIKPVGILKEITIKDFENIYAGEGKNEDLTPLENIYPEGDILALFALTLGTEIVDAINDLLDRNDFAPGIMLDSVASIAADKAVEVLETYLFNNLSERKLTKDESIVLGYSPGYCGWHLSGQKKLFQHLKPEEIGITINESYLMFPLKSVSGVLVHGDKEIHRFDPAFNFCSDCKDQTCYDRMERIYSN